MYLGVTLLVLMGSDCIRYSKHLEDLKNQYTQGMDNYPKSLTEAYNLLIYWENDLPHVIRALNPTGVEGAAYSQRLEINWKSER